MSSCRSRDRDSSEYLHHGWCQDAFRDPLYRQQVKLQLQNLGVDVTTIRNANDKQLCELLGENVCRSVQLKNDPQYCASTNIPVPNRILLQCGKRRTCFDVLELQRRITTNEEYARKFSDYQKHKIQSKYKVAQSFVRLPCNAFQDPNCETPDTVACADLSGNRDLCTRVKRCKFQTSEGIRARLKRAFTSYQPVPGQCTLKRQELLNLSKTCYALDIKLLQMIMVDVYFKYVYGYRGYKPREKLAQFYLKSDRLYLATHIRHQITQANIFQQRQTLCSWVYDRVQGKSNSFPWVKRNATILVFALGAFRVRQDFFQSIQQALNVRFRQNNDTYMLTLLTAISNIVLYGSECDGLGPVHLIAMFPAAKYATRALFSQDAKNASILLLISWVMLGISADQAMAHYIHLTNTLKLPRFTWDSWQATMSNIKFQARVQFDASWFIDEVTATDPRTAWQDFYGKVYDPIQQVIQTNI